MSHKFTRIVEAADGALSAASDVPTRVRVAQAPPGGGAGGAGATSMLPGGMQTAVNVYNGVKDTIEEPTGSDDSGDPNVAKGPRAANQIGRDERAAISQLAASGYGDGVQAYQDIAPHIRDGLFPQQDWPNIINLIARTDQSLGTGLTPVANYIETLGKRYSGDTQRVMGDFSTLRSLDTRFRFGLLKLAIGIAEQGLDGSASAAMEDRMVLLQLKGVDDDTIETVEQILTGTATGITPMGAQMEGVERERARAKQTEIAGALDLATFNAEYAKQIYRYRRETIEKARTWFRANENGPLVQNVARTMQVITQARAMWDALRQNLNMTRHPGPLGATPSQVQVPGGGAPGGSARASQSALASPPLALRRAGRSVMPEERFIVAQAGVAPTALTGNTYALDGDTSAPGYNPSAAPGVPGSDAPTPRPGTPSAGMDAQQAQMERQRRQTMDPNQHPQTMLTRHQAGIRRQIADLQSMLDSVVASIEKNFASLKSMGGEPDGQSDPYMVPEQVMSVARDIAQQVNDALGIATKLQGVVGQWQQPSGGSPYPDAPEAAARESAVANVENRAAQLIALRNDAMKLAIAAPHEMRIAQLEMQRRTAMATYQQTQGILSGMGGDADYATAIASASFQVAQERMAIAQTYMQFGPQSGDPNFAYFCQRQAAKHRALAAEAESMAASYMTQSVSPLIGQGRSLTDPINQVRLNGYRGNSLVRRASGSHEECNVNRGVKNDGKNDDVDNPRGDTVAQPSGSPLIDREADEQTRRYWDNLYQNAPPYGDMLEDARHEEGERGGPLPSSRQTGNRLRRHRRIRRDAA